MGAAVMALPMNKNAIILSIALDPMLMIKA
jgi:hypothetical protein